MIANCRTCKKSYWRFWPNTEPPPGGYCSILCYESRGSRQEDPPESPATVLQFMYRHRSITHQTTSILAWFDCEECERLECLYADSLDYHYKRITREIAQGAA